MIDIEPLVFTTVATALRSEFSGISVYGETVDVPASFPCVMLIEEDNTTLRETQDDELTEHHATLMYSVNVYSNLASGRKVQAKQIMDVIDEAMQGMKFTRTMRSQTPNQERDIYRITARYTAIVERGIADGDDTVYQMYRR